MDDKILFYALDLRNISRLVKTKTKTRAQCLMVNTGSLTKCDNSLSLRFFFVIQQTTKVKTVVFSVSAIDVDTGVGPNAQGNKEVIFDIVGGDSVKISTNVKHHILESSTYF